MSERKVLNKYYPPDFDPSKIPKLREPKNKTFSIRIMAPFNMRCNVCGEYIYKGKKFNSRKENVDDEDFLGLRIFRFYIRCPKCVAEIAFKTDLKNTDYTLEAGATRLFEAEKKAQQMAEEERREKEAEELNPMTVLENRTKASHKEMAQIDELEELREINARHAKVDTDVLIQKQQLYEEHLLRLQQEEEDRFIQSIFGNKKEQVVKRLADPDSDDDSSPSQPAKKKVASHKPSDILTDTTAAPDSVKQDPPKPSAWQKSAGKLSTKSSLAGLVRKKPPPKTSAPNQSEFCVSSNGDKPLKDNGNCETAASSVRGLEASGKTTVNEPNSVSSCAQSAAVSTVSSASGSALGLLGGYSGSESDSSE